MHNIAHIDRDRAFDDWSVPVVFRQVVQTYDPQTGRVEETATDTAVQAIVRPLQSSPHPGTVAVHPDAELAAILRTDDLPADANLATARLVHDQQEYQVRSFTRSSDSQLVEVLAVRIGDHD
ncbi:hypothetical protein Mal4_54010 [Maioricimonas rarisocia]|uniref:Phage head-tail joining protein n=1 Tax=Maioricimonas rarisocia TaxID=2528026 RepID=A0A517ZEZ9_9PLAN|nr:hypothetical protein [Maioricimonas rarisocia]QDU41036.1 hypothetical protein Mal4_54010 [Maioricimonas rarisocia]